MYQEEVRICIVQKQFREDLAEWIRQDRRIASKVLTMMEDVIRLQAKCHY